MKLSKWSGKMEDTIDRSIELLQSAVADQNWDLVLEVIQLLNKLPQEGPDSEDEGEGFEIDICKD